MAGDATRVQRRLAAILAADVVGFSALMGKDEEVTLAQIKSLRREVIEPKVQEHHGRVFKTTGDGVLVEFASPVEAVRCAVGIQETIAAAAAQKTFSDLELRIGINVGDILVEEDGDVYGDGVNVAVRLEQLAEPGGVCLSGKVYEEVRDKLPYAFETGASSRSRTSHDPFGFMHWNLQAKPARLNRDHRPSHCQTSLRSQCYPSTISVATARMIISLMGLSKTLPPRSHGYGHFSLSPATRHSPTRAER
jgi:adenylate cyclase